MCNRRSVGVVTCVSRVLVRAPLPPPGMQIAALLEWIVKARPAGFLDAGLTHADVFKLVWVADDYRTGEFGPETLATIHDFAPKFNAVKIVK